MLAPTLASLPPWALAQPSRYAYNCKCCMRASRSAASCEPGNVCPVPLPPHPPRLQLPAPPSQQASCTGFWSNVHVMQTHRRRRPGSVISRAIARRTLPATQNTAVQGTPRSVQQFGVCLVRIISGNKLAQERPQCPSIVPCFAVLHRTRRHAASTHMPCRTSAGRRHPGQQTNFGAR